MMKKPLLLIGAALMLTTVTYAQTFNYSTNTGWSTNIRTLITPPIGCAFSALTTLNPGGNPNTTLINTTSGRVEFTSVYGAHENRIFTNLGNSYDDSYTVDFDFNMSDAPVLQSHGTAVMPMVLSSQNLNPAYSVPMTTCNQAPNMDVLSVWIGSSGGSSTANPRASVFVWDNGSLVPGNTAFISIAYNTTYYARVRVFDDEKGELALYSNADRTTLVGKFCFHIPSTVNQLTFLQHSTSTGAGPTRFTTAWVDNTSIYRSSGDCCNLAITSGPSVLCKPTSATYGVTTNGTNVTYSVSPSDVMYTTNANGTITITNWGSMPINPPKVITITATAVCSCDTLSTSMNVYLYYSQDPAFNVVGLASNGTQLTDFSAVSSAGAASVIHTWELFTSDAASTVGTLIRGPYTSTGVGSTFNVTAATPSPVLMTGSYYLVRHRMEYPSGLCGPYEATRLIYISQSAKLIDLGDVSGMTQSEVAKRTREMEHAAKANTVKVFPNPSDNEVRIEANAALREVVLMDADGRILKTLTVQENAYVLDLSGHAAGTYFLKITTDNGTQLERVVKR